MIGPSIPSHLSKKNEAEIEISLSDEEEQDFGPQIPSNITQKKNANEIDITEEDQSIGPQIPSHLMQKKKNQANSISDNGDHANIGPQIPKHLLEKKNTNDNQNASNIGPQIPQHLLQKNSNKDEIQISDDEDMNDIGPQIPQQEEENPDDFAPALPPDLLEQRQKQQQEPQQQPQPTGRRRRPVGPTFPVGPIPTADDDVVVGPSLPSDYNPEVDAKSSAIQAIEERARQAKEAIEKKKNGKEKVERPEWMLLPPEVDYLKQASSGKSRQFTNKAVSKEDLANSGWTDTPADKERKLKESGKRKADDYEQVYHSAKDAEQRRNVQEYNMQTRPMSLLEMHQMKKKKERKSGKGTDVEDVTKRAFDREKDLLGSRPMDKKQKKELLRQSNELSKGFGYGRNSFL